MHCRIRVGDGLISRAHRFHLAVPRSTNSSGSRTERQGPSYWQRSVVVFVCALAVSYRSAAAAEPAFSAEAIEFFEKDVRPLLAERCYVCHGEKKQQASLRLDSRAAALKGGENGPAMVAGEPEQSRLIHAIRRSGDLAMPPDKPLAPTEVAILERWVKQGAPWPLNDPQSGSDLATRWKTHWAFQTLAQPVVPTVSTPEWCQTDVDRFILARLDAAGLSPSPPADRRTLIRRATYDLTGLPPTPEDVETFVSDADPQAYAKLIDRLLDSPQYGVQWARHWLDIARYSDTKGYVYAREERFWLHAPVYRDWVVEAFNSDLPFDRFLLLQIAADQVAPDDRASLAAMGFLTLGRRFLGVTHDIIDDRIDVVMRGAMGLTVGCARCHDHKYDPIPTADYYSLYGVFLNVAERVVPISEPATRDAAYEAFETELKAREQKLADALATAKTEASRGCRELVTEYLWAQRELSKWPEEGFDVLISKGEVVPAFVRRWQWYLAAAESAHDPIFVPWHEYGKLSDAEFAQRAPAVTAAWAEPGSARVNPLVAAQFVTPPTSMRDVAERYGRLLAHMDRQWQAQLKSAAKNSTAPPTSLVDPAAEALRQVLYGPRAPCETPDESIVGAEMFFPTRTCEALWKLQGDVDRWLIQSPLAPAYAVTLYDRGVLREPRIFKRGNPANRGDEVPRRFVSAVAGPQRPPFTHGSGRLEMARAIVEPGNPLTPRVWVNRVWLHHFGAGLVRTPSDFGIRAEPPSHPELLDWLSKQLINQGWSTKAIHRLILLSATYQQRSDRSDPEVSEIRRSTSSTSISRPNAGNPEHNRAETVSRALQIDPDNRLLWRMNPRRLSFEEFRDTLLMASGELDLQRGGRASDLLSPTNRRRSIYGLVDRQFLLSVLRVFDFANPDLHIPVRSETTVPQQALFAMNHPFVADRVRSLTAEVKQTAGDDPRARARALYQRVYQRSPTALQEQASLNFLDAAVGEPRVVPSAESQTWQYGWGKIDPAASKLVSFAKLPHFSGAAWQGGPQWPDANLGWAQLTANGGHPGNDLDHAVIRRWIAPRTMTVAIQSTAIHEEAVGDGVRCWIFSSRHGLLHAATLHNRRQSLNVDALAVQAGDTLDFVVDIAGNLNSDQHLWSPEIREIVAADAASAAGGWFAARDFSGPTLRLLEPWEQLAQVLLLGNELMFVD